MTCREAVIELVECARRDDRMGVAPGRELRGHLAMCGACSERWDAERGLTAHLAAIRKQTAGIGSSAGRREALIAEFGRIYSPLPASATRAKYARWGLVAAGLLFVIALGHQAGSRSKVPQPVSHGVRTEPAVLYESNSLSTDASTISSDDFVAIPYMPPLAPGEMVRIVRADMYPEALASLGVTIDLLAWSGRAVDVPVEMVVGEDGIPRAVRITESSSF
jgi:hypothetical protein